MNRNLYYILATFILLLGVVEAYANDQEVVVMGGTPGGISATLAAARAGRTVVLIEYHSHIGGMMTSGLGKSDIENRDIIGGIFKEFISKSLSHYVNQYGIGHENVKLCRDGYYFEPSVAESIFENLLKEEPKAIILKGWRLKKTIVTNNRLTAIEIINRQSGEVRTLKAKVFIDATYEGDLFAAAGADFFLGRESREKYNEPHAGVIYYDYKAKKILPGTTGEADQRLPAYTYRLCMTTDPKNAYRIKSPPPNYNRKNYLGYFDDLKAGRLAGPKSFKPGRGYNPAHFGTMVRALSVTYLPNQKTDVNINPRPLGFPFVEVNKGYVKGNDETRLEICKRHRNLVLGLLWFLQNDSEIPEAHRILANELHLAKDEFRDNDHFPYQLYVREGRRLDGEYLLIEQDITRSGNRSSSRYYKDSIAVGEFPIDSFPCRKRQATDTVVLEGYLGMLDHITRPYEIPYRIMIPKKIEGLIVPVAASTTHVAFSSIRMEPTWMALGQAAGVAANLSIEHNLTPRNIPIIELQELLIKQGQVIRHHSK
jgi:FAD dependent oxidoreductase